MNVHPFFSYFFFARSRAFARPLFVIALIAILVGLPAGVAACEGPVASAATGAKASGKPHFGQAEAFEHLVTEYDVASPLSDLLRGDLPEEVASRVRSARHLGTVTIAGTRCDHLAFRGERVDFQLFVRQGEEPVPIRFAIDYHAEAGRPQFRAQLGSWDSAPELPESLFQFLPPVGSQRVAFPELLDLLLGSTAAESEVP